MRAFPTGCFRLKRLGAKSYLNGMSKAQFLIGNDEIIFLCFTQELGVSMVILVPENNIFIR